MGQVNSCKVIAYFTVIPMGTESTSIGRYVAAAVAAINRLDGLRCEVTPMGTVIEAESLDAVFEAVKTAHKALADMGVARVTSTLHIDDRRDKPRTIKDKVNSVKKHMKQLRESADAKSGAH